MSSTARSTLACGAVAGPLFATVGLAQACSRAGFDLNQHTLSLLSNGGLGWIQIANFIVSGALFVAATTGMRRVVTSGRAATWGPRLIAVFGAGTLAVGAFVPGPAYGFLPGTPDRKPASVSWHGVFHYTIASLAFLALIVACFVFASRFRNLGQRGGATCSALIGALLVIGVGAISSGSPNATANLSFVTAALLGFLWVSALAARLRSEAEAPAPRRSPRSTGRKQASAPTAG
jgi:heme A synthase